MSVASAKWNAAHKKECALATARYRTRHPEKVREYSKKWREEVNPEYLKEWAKRNPAKRRVTEAKWREANRERHLATQRERHRRYRASHPEQGRLGQQRRRERVKNAKSCDTVSANILCQLISSPSKLKCGICGKNMPKNDRTIDHVIPLSKGGTGEIWNLRIVHLVCNLEKNAKMPDELPL